MTESPHSWTSTDPVPEKDSNVEASLEDGHLIFDVASAGSAPIAEEALRRIGELYDIEREVRGSPPEVRRQTRQDRSRPRFEALRPWLEARLVEISGKSATAEAIRYAINRWQALGRLLDDGTVEIDNNAAERAIRPIRRPVSLCSPSSSVCKHWKCVDVNDATRATFPGDRRLNRLRCQVAGADLPWRAGNNLLGGKGSRLNKAA